MTKIFSYTYNKDEYNKDEYNFTLFADGKYKFEIKRIDPWIDNEIIEKTSSIKNYS